MAKLLKTYVCQSCGAASSKWQGQCADCGSWNTMVEESAPAASPFAQKHHLQKGGRRLSLEALNVETALPKRLSTGIGELDRALGGGLVAGSATLLGGDPGIGKSTLLLQAAGLIARAGPAVVQVPGGDADEQVPIGRASCRERECKSGLI